MKLKIMFAALAALACAPPAMAQVLSSDQVTGQPGTVQGTASDGKRVKLPVYVPVRADGTVIDPAGGGSGASASQVQGNSAASATDTGNPVKIGCIGSGTAPTAATAGQRVNSWCGLNGQSVIAPYSSPLGVADAQANVATVAVDAGLNVVRSISRSEVFNGSTWDRLRGDTNGQFAQGNVAAGAADSGNPVKVGCIGNNSPPTAVTSGQRANAWCSVNGATVIGVAANTAIDGLSNVQVGFVAAASPANNAMLGTAGFLFNGTSWDRQRGDTSGTYVVEVASPSSNAGVVSVASTAVTGGQVIKASAGNLYGFNVVSGASAGYVLVFNSATVPADGAVTPARCLPLAANTGLDVNLRGQPAYFSTGIAIAFSTTGCFNKTASATAFIAGDAK